MEPITAITPIKFRYLIAAINPEINTKNAKAYSFKLKPNTPIIRFDRLMYNKASVTPDLKWFLPFMTTSSSKMKLPKPIMVKIILITISVESNDLMIILAKRPMPE